MRGLSGIFLRRAWIIALSVLVFASAALLAAELHTKRYTATTALVFREQTFGEELFGAEELRARESARKAATTDRLVALPVISQRTADALPGEFSRSQIEDSIEIQIDPDSNVINLNATDSDPATAAAIANTYANQYVDFSRDANRKILRRAIDRAKASSAHLLESSSDQEAGRTLRSSIGRLQVLSTLQTGDIDHVETARPPGKASWPHPPREMLLGAVIGLVLGVALAAIAANLDRRVRDVRELETAFGVPVIGAFRQADRASAPAGWAPGLSALSESSVDLLRARLRYFNVDREIRTLLVTSSGDGDGKSTVIWNLAVEAARSGAKTIVIESDFRRPSIAAGADFSAGPGLSELLSGQAGLSEVLQAKAGPGDREGITPDAIVAGGPPPNGTLLLEGQAMDRLLDELGEQGYEMILIDAASLSESAGAAALLARVDGVIVVGRIGRTTQGQARALGEQLRLLGAPVLGAVANVVSPRDRYASSLGARI